MFCKNVVWFLLSQPLAPFFFRWIFHCYVLKRQHFACHSYNFYWKHFQKCFNGKLLYTCSKTINFILQLQYWVNWTIVEGTVNILALFSYPLLILQLLGTGQLNLKGSVTRDFLLLVFLHRSVYHMALYTLLEPFRIFTKISEHIRK
jgi:hypothetical protein